MTLPKFFTFIIFGIWFLSSPSIATISSDDLKKIELDFRIQIETYGQNQENLVFMGNLLQNRNFQPGDDAHFLSETTTLGMAAICFQKAFLLNQDNGDYPLSLAKIFENWAKSEHDSIQNKKQTLKKYQLCLSNYALYFFMTKETLPRIEISRLSKEFHDNLWPLFFDSKEEALIWIYTSIFGDPQIQMDVFKNKASDPEKSSFLWDFLFNFQKIPLDLIKSILNMINTTD